MKINCAIIDDEPLSQDILIKYVNEIDRLHLIGVCDNALEANKLLQEQNIVLIFLDINMPRLSGLQFFRSLSNPPLVIFTTAYPEFAVDGFEVDAVDYLVKPFPFERFLKAVNKAFEKIDNNVNNSAEDVLWLKSDKKLNRVNITEILFIEATGDYVKVVMENGNLLVHETMQAICEKLASLGFVRIHRSYIAAMNKIDYIEGNMVRIQDRMLPVGQAYRESFNKKLKH
jgi:DNA-binding LytR/AlgR family response regulator